VTNGRHKNQKNWQGKPGFSWVFVNKNHDFLVRFVVTTLELTVYN
jgi:hypothetical protein